MNLLYALESVRTPFWDAVFSAVTHLGEETVFMVAAILIFWCVSKQGGVLSAADGLFRHGGEPVPEAAVPDSPALGPGP